MRGFSILALGTAALALFSALPTACGAAIEKRDAASDATSILNDATSQVTALKAQLGTAFAGDLGNALFVTTTVVPLVTSMNAILGETAGKITALNASAPASKGKRQVDTNIVATALVDLVNEVEVALNPLITFLETIPLVDNLLGGLLAGLDANLTTIASGLGTVVAGVLEVVAELLGSVLAGLSGLGFVNFLAVIGSKL